MSLILSAPFKADLAPDDKRFIAHCKWLLSQNCGLRPTLPRRRPIKVERDNAGGVVERVRNNRDPQIATGGEKDEPHGEADRSGEQQCRAGFGRRAPIRTVPPESHTRCPIPVCSRRRAWPAAEIESLGTGILRQIPLR